MSIKPPKNKVNKKEVYLSEGGAVEKKRPLPDNLAKPHPEEEKSIFFKVPIHMHAEFKSYAAKNGYSMKDLFIKMYEEYRINHK